MPLGRMFRWQQSQVLDYLHRVSKAEINASNFSIKLALGSSFRFHHERDKLSGSRRRVREMGDCMCNPAGGFRNYLLIYPIFSVEISQRPTARI